MRRVATLARRITESTNTAAIRILERGCMGLVAAYVLMHVLPVTTPSKSTYGIETPTLATTADIDDIINYLNVSNIFPAVGGLYYQGFIAFSITGELLKEKVAAQEIYLLPRWDRLDGLAIAEPHQGHLGQHLFIGCIDVTN